MAADVSTLVRMMNGGYRDDLTVANHRQSADGGSSTSPITRDLLGGGRGGCYGSSSSSINNESQELDLDMQVPTGWEKRLDLKSGRVYLQRCNFTTSMSTSSSDRQKTKPNQTVARLQDLNFPPSTSSKVTLNLFDEGSLGLKLVSSSPLSSPSSSSPSSSSVYQSVCTLEKVKSALERADKEPLKKRRTTGCWKSPSPPSSSASSLSFMEVQDVEDRRGQLWASPVATGCPGCLSYVLVMKSNPKCPRCNTLVPLQMSKQPKIDLNMSI